MNKEDITYINSDLRKNLNTEILERFPVEIRNCMIAVYSVGDMLRIPTEREIFGTNIHGEDETVKRWIPMKKKRNCIALQGVEGPLKWYWLMRRHRSDTSLFANVTYDGDVRYSYATTSIGVRPVFMLRNATSQNLEPHNIVVEDAACERAEQDKNVEHPSHYVTGKYECIDVMQETQGKEAVMDFCLCNAFKYLYRTQHKNGFEDIKKARWYLNKYIELKENNSIQK